MSEWKRFNCGSERVTWDNDASLEDVGIDRKGILQSFHCMDCHCDIEYYIYEDSEDEA